MSSAQTAPPRTLLADLHHVLHHEAVRLRRGDECEAAAAHVVRVIPRLLGLVPVEPARGGARRAGRAARASTRAAHGCRRTAAWARSCAR
eukprot:scaffold32323_cov107-Isochrysis_galbana.AAC.1